MRIRSIKPEFWRSADTAGLSMFARLLFIGLWSYVDDNGVGEDDVNLIRSDLFPRDDNIDELRQMIGRAVDELSAWHMIVRYEHATTGRQYLAIANWHHQKISHPTRSSKPLPTSDNVKIISLSGITPEQFGSPPEPLRPDLGNKGTREQGNKGTRERGSLRGETRGTRLPTDWSPPPEVVAQMRSDHPHVNLDTELDKFRDHWHAQPGAKGRKADWPAVYRNWIRREAASHNNARARPSTTDALIAQTQALKKQIPPTTGTAAMNREELIDVLTAVQVIDHRTIGNGDITMWGAIIGNLPKDDALQAVIDHRREQAGVWLEPGHIVAGVRAIRRERHERQSERERAEREAICDAKAAAMIDTIVAELAERKTIPDDEPPRYIRPSADPATAPLLQVACPYCRASVGQRCTNNATKTQLRAPAHPARLAAATAGHEHDTAVPLCTACHTRPLITLEDEHRGTCDHCTPHIAQPKPKTEAPERNNA